MDKALEYVGFWKRVLASLIDTTLLLMITLPILLSIYGWAYLDSDELIQGPADFLVSWVVPALLIIAFWTSVQSTSGKMVFRAKIVDANHGGPPGTVQFVVRYLGYFVSTIPFGLGLLWVGWDPRKQGWHDKMAATVVVRPKSEGAGEVRFPDADLIDRQPGEPKP